MPPTHLLAAPGLRLGPTRPRFERVAVEDARAGGGRRLLFVATVLIAVAGALGFLKTWPPFATVMSASMAPTINTGDVVVLKRLDGPARVGQVVMVRVPDEARSRYGYPPVVIHRVARIAPDGAVTTKGDAKKEVDPFTVPRTAITTRVLTHIPAAGQIFAFFGSTLGLLWLAGGAALFFAMPAVERYRDAQRRADTEREERELVLEALRAQVELLPRQIECAVANAVAAIEPRTRPEPATIVMERPAPTVTPAVVAGPAPRCAAPVVRIVSAAVFAAVAPARLAPVPAPAAPATPPSRFPAPAPVFTPAISARFVAAPAPASPAIPPSRFPAPAPVFTPAISARFVAAPAPASPAIPPSRFPAPAPVFTPAISARFVAAPAPPVPATPRFRRPASVHTFAPVVAARSFATPVRPAPAAPSSRFRGSAGGGTARLVAASASRAVVRA